MKRAGFFEHVLDQAPSGVHRLVVVTHLVPGVDEFLMALNQVTPVAAVIPKPRSIDSRTLATVGRQMPVLHTTRSQLTSEPAGFLWELSQRLAGQAYAVIDTGGYFSHLLQGLSGDLQRGLVGIVEDTENGHQKYQRWLDESAGGEFPCPVMSVARSPLKNPEDHLVGQAVAFSADAMLRECGQVLTSKNALVLGYGKIGSSLAAQLRAKGARVTVIDVNPMRQVLAVAHGFGVLPLAEALASHELVFGATGNRSMGLAELGAMRPGSYVFAATSGDDEFLDHPGLIALSVATEHPRIRAIGGQRRVYLCNDGHSVNFLHGGVVGPFIQLVQAELAAATGHLAGRSNDRIHELDYPARAWIAQTWLEHHGIH